MPRRGSRLSILCFVASFVLWPTMIFGQFPRSNPAQSSGYSIPPGPGEETPEEPFQPTSDLVIPSENARASENGLTVTPYGSLWANMYFATSRTNPGSFTLWVFSEEQQGEPAFDLDARRSRVGITVDGPKTGPAGYQYGGKVEFDFFGQFLTENRAGARLRHAYFEASHEDWRFLVGQTWDIISPLRPGMLNFTGGWAGGNIGFRRAQFRVERTLDFGAEKIFLLQGSLNQDIVDDFPSDPGVRRESSDYPVLEARAAIQLAAVGDSAKPMTFGLSGHYGETGFDFIQPGPPPLNLPLADDTRFTTWSINLDAEVPLSPEWTIRGEAFQGANLSPFFGGIGQGVCPCLRKSIRSTGGWLELVRVWSPAWESHCGGGIDDPRNEDSLMGRVQNQFLFGNLIWHVTEELSTGWEIAYWRTLYHDRRAGQIPPSMLSASTPGEALTVEWMVRYDF